MQSRASHLRVAVDLTAVETADFRVRFVEGLIRYATHAEFILLTSARSPSIDAASPRVVVPDPTPFEALLTRVDARLPGQSRRARLSRNVVWPKSVRRAQAHWGLLRRLKTDVVFCPFTPSRVRDGVTPLVAAVHDLQHAVSPHLLRSSQRARRALEFETIARRASHILCASDEVRSAVADSREVVSKRVVMLAPGRLLAQIQPPQNSQPDQCVLIPGGVEPRHNHALVMTAFAQFRARHPRSRLKLTWAGASAPRLETAVRAMALEDYMRFSSHDLIALMQRCKAVLVPSLYETIGEHVLQAMALSRPVLCSSLPSLLDLVGDAALTFDQHRPTDLLDLFERIDSQPSLLTRHGQLARQRFTALDDPASVADAYISVFNEAKQCLATSR